MDIPWDLTVFNEGTTRDSSPPRKISPKSERKLPLRNHGGFVDDVVANWKKP